MPLLGHKEANLTAVVDPTVNDDSSLGYSVASLWINVTTGTVFQCVDASVGAAVWKDLGTTFLSLPDTPNSYTGEGGKVAAVKATEDGMEFIAGGGGAADHIVDADSDTEVHVEKAADEDKVRVKAGGVERLLVQTASPHVQLTGDVKIVDRMAIASSPTSLAYLGLTPDISGSSAGYLIQAQPSGSKAGGNLYALSLSAVITQTAAMTNFIGVGAHLIPVGPQPISVLASVQGGLGTMGTGVPGLAAFFDTYGYGWSGKPSELAIFRAAMDLGHAGIGTVRGLHIVDQSGGTVNLVEIGPSVPYFKVVGGIPGSGLSNIYIRIGATSKRVSEGSADSGGSGYRALRVPN